MEIKSRQKAIEAARRLFIKKGRDGVRMQEIADEAKINKGLLHYYFKSKDSLFKEIFATEFGAFYADINQILEDQDSMDGKLSAIIDRYFTLLQERPGLPAFVLFEINKNPAMIDQLTSKVDLQKTIRLLDEEFRKNKITSSPAFAFQVMLNIISLCVFPFMMKPMVVQVSGGNENNFDELMAYRRAFLKQVIINSFKP